MDIESDPVQGNFIGIGLALQGTISVYWPVGHVLETEVNVTDSELDEVIDAIKASPLRVMHNAAYDLFKLKDFSIDLTDLPFVCTMIAFHMLHEEEFSKKLESMAKYYGLEEKAKPPEMQRIIDTMGWNYVPFMLMNEYCCQDALLASQGYLKIKEEFNKEFGDFYEV